CDRAPGRSGARAPRQGHQRRGRVPGGHTPRRGRGGDRARAGRAAAPLPPDVGRDRHREQLDDDLPGAGRLPEGVHEIGLKSSRGGAMTILVTGSRGLIGSALVPALRAAGHSVARAVRGAVRASDEVSWEPATGRLGPGAFEVVVHLAGENLTSGPWTATRR